MELAVDGGSGDGGAVFGILWGVVATVMGGLLVSNYRGFTEWFVGQAARRQNTDRRLAQSRVIARLVGGVFAVVGPVILVVSVVSAARGHLGLGALLHRDANFTSGAARYIYPVMAIVWMVQFWFPRRGMFVPVWRRPGRLARALTVVATVSALAFSALAGLGYLPLATLPLVIAGASSMAALRPFSRRASESGD
jgi:hypothetical protein